MNVRGIPTAAYQVLPFAALSRGYLPWQGIGGYVPYLGGSPHPPDLAGGRGYLPWRYPPSVLTWPGGRGYLPWRYPFPHPDLVRGEGVSTLDREGTYLGGTPPVLIPGPGGWGRRYLPWMGVLTLDRGVPTLEVPIPPVLTWPRGRVPTLDGGGGYLAQGRCPPPPVVDRLKT